MDGRADLRAERAVGRTGRVGRSVDGRVDGQADSPRNLPGQYHKQINSSRDESLHKVCCGTIIPAVSIPYQTTPVCS